MKKNDLKFENGIIVKRLMGFGLLEVLISATIIIVILGSLVTVARASMNNNQYMQMRAQATYLAQEGIEKVRQIRDTNWIDGNNATGWDNLDLNEGGNRVASGCYETTNMLKRFSLRLISDVQSLAACENYAKLIDENNTEEIDFGGSYYRTIYIDSDLPSRMFASSEIAPEKNAIKVSTTVGFVFRGQKKYVSASEIITNWRPNY